MAAVVKPRASPYQGLFPFEEDDAPFFFGRKREVRLIVANLYAAPLTLLYGPTGVGKTSILRAGVMDRLSDRERHGDALALWFASWQSPGGAGSALKAAIARPAAGATPTADGSLLDAVRALVKRTRQNVMLVLDQFEEYFLYHPRGDVLDRELVELLTQRDLPVGVLISIREDSLAALDRFQRYVPGLFENLLRLRHLDEVQAQAAIEGPLDRFEELYGERVRPGRKLVATVLADIRSASLDPGPWNPERDADEAFFEAPYLQLVMDRLWATERKRGSKVLHAGTLETLGGSAGIVRQHLDVALGALPAEQRGVAADVFEYLVTPSGSKIALTRDDLAGWTGRDAEPIGDILHRLADMPWLLRRIVPPDGNLEGARYEIAHDVLAREVAEWRKRMVEARDERERLMKSGTTFEALVVAYRRRRAEEREGAVSAETDARYLNQVGAFEAHRGRLVQVWWGGSGAARALTEQRGSGLRRALRPRLTLHRLDTRLAGDSAVASRLRMLIRLAAEASSSTGPPGERAAKEGVFEIESRLLEALENPDADRDAALELADEEISLLRSRLEDDARRAAPFAYLTGVMTALVIGLSLTGAALAAGLDVDGRTAHVGTGFVAGMISAALSLVGRLTTKRQPIRPGASRWTLRLIGFTRPLIGGALGLLLAVVLTSGLFPAGDWNTATITVLALLAGYGERLIGDVAVVRRGGGP